MDANAATPNVIVNFDPTTRTVSFPSLPQDNKIHIDADPGRVNFQLTAPGRVFFPSNPIQWVNADLEPIDPPSGTAVTRAGVAHVTIQVDATKVPSTDLSFYVIVQTLGGRFFGTDPTIVTMRPPGGGGNEDNNP